MANNTLLVTTIIMIILLILLSLAFFLTWFFVWKNCGNTAVTAVTDALPGAWSASQKKEVDGRLGPLFVKYITNFSASELPATFKTKAVMKELREGVAKYTKNMITCMVNRISDNYNFKEVNDQFKRVMKTLNIDDLPSKKLQNDLYKYAENCGQDKAFKDVNVLLKKIAYERR